LAFLVFFDSSVPLVVLSHIAVLDMDTVAFSSVGETPRVVDQATVVRCSKSAASSSSLWLTRPQDTTQSWSTVTSLPGREHRA
jgi:hypothetical protein